MLTWAAAEKLANNTCTHRRGAAYGINNNVIITISLIHSAFAYLHVVDVYRRYIAAEMVLRRK